MRADALRSPGRRIAVMRAIGLLLFLGLAARAAHLTVVDPRGPKRRDLQLHTTLEITGARGAVFDREGRELAVTVPQPSIFAIASELKSQTTPAQRRALAAALGKTPAALEARLEDRSGFTYLARWVDAASAERVAALDLEGVGRIDEARRRYPAGRLAGPVLGFADIDGAGVRGIEQQEDAWLRGEAHSVGAQRDGRGRLLAVGATDPAFGSGGEIRLTLDLAAQSAAEEALREAVEQSGARSGIALSLIPKTGEILALAEAPGFDPNEFRHLRYARTGSRAFLDAFEPGSTLKIFAIASALEAGVIDADTSIDCSGGEWHVPGGGKVRDRRDFGVLSLADVLRLSSNIGSARIGHAVGPRLHYESLLRFGFGRRTARGDAAFPSESSGLLRSWQDWQPIDHATISFGQGVNVTAIQLAAAVGALANDGEWIEPRLVAARRRPGAPWQALPDRERVRAVRPDTARRVRELMEHVTREDGTGRLAALRGVRVAGKTGTAQKLDAQTGRYSQDRHLAWFVGMAPAEDPKLVVVTVLDEPQRAHTGGAVAAPLFANVAARHLAHWGISTEALRDPREPRVVAENPPALPASVETRTLAAAAAPRVAAEGGPRPAPTAVAAAPEPTAAANKVDVPLEGAMAAAAATPAAVQEERILVPHLLGHTRTELERIAAAHSLELEILEETATHPATGTAAPTSSAQWPVAGSILGAGERRVIVRFGERAPTPQGADVPHTALAQRQEAH